MAPNRRNPYQNGPPLPPISGAGPVAYVGSPALPLPPLGSQTRPPPPLQPLQKITVQPPPVIALPPVPSLGNQGSGGMADAFKARLLNQLLAPPVDPNQDLKDAIRSKQIHDLLYPPKDPHQAAQEALDAENYARYLRGEPPIEVANALAAQERADKARESAAEKDQKATEKAQAAKDKAQKAAEDDAKAIQAKRTAPWEHYLANADGIRQYGEDFGLNLSPDDIAFLDQQGLYAASQATTNAPRDYWAAVEPTRFAVDLPGDVIVDPRTGEPILDPDTGLPQRLPGSKEGDVDLESTKSSVIQMLQSPRYAQAYGGDAEGGTVRRGLAQNPIDEMPAPDTSQDSPSGHLSGLGQGYSNQEDTSYYPAPWTSRHQAMGEDQNTLPLPPGGALPGQTPDLRTQATHALQGGVVGGIVAAAAALIGRRLGLDPIKAGLVAAGLVGAGDVAVEQGWVAPAVGAVNTLLSGAQHAFQANLVNAANPPTSLSPQSDLSPLIDAVSNAYAKTDPSQNVLERLDQALTIAASPFEQKKEALTAPLSAKDSLLGPAGPLAQGVANTSIDLVSNPVMWDPAMWSGAALKGAVGLGAANYAKSALSGETPAEQARAVEEGANIGLMAGPAVEGAIKLIRRYVTKPTVPSVVAPPVAPVAPVEAGVAPATVPAGRTVEAIQADLAQANEEWAQFRQANPDMPLAEQVQHPAAQRIAALADERDAVLNPVAPPPANAVAPEEPAPAVAPLVAPSPPVVATAPLLHPVTGENLATGDQMRDTETRLALDNFTQATQALKTAKGKRAITAATKNLQAAAQAIGGSDTAQVDALIQKALEPTAPVVPPVVPPSEVPAEAPSAMDDLLAEQSARAPVPPEAAPLAEPSVPLTEATPPEVAPEVQSEVAPPPAEVATAPVEEAVPQGKPLEGPVGHETVAAGADPNTTYAMRYRVVPLDDLIASNTESLAANPEYAAELQPRDRARAASRTQIDKIAQTLNPDALLHDAGQLDRGPMIVGPDSMVESGNGRVLALRTARTSAPERFSAYVEQLKATAPSLGIDPAQLEGIKDPVLVRERVSPVDRAAFAAEANARASLGMSTAESALQDAQRLSGASVGRIWVGSDLSLDQALQAAANRPIQRDFIASLPENDRADLLDAEGNLNKVGLERLKAAVFARTYPGSAGQRLTAAFFESLDPTVQTIKQGIYANLPAMARAVGMMETGVRDASLNAADDIAKAVDVFARLKQDGLRVDDYLAQMSMFDRELTPLQEKILAFLGENGRSSKRVREFLDGYTSAVEKAPPPQQMGLFDTAQPTKEGVIESVLTQIQRDQDNTGLFALRGTGAAEEAAFAPTAENGPQLAGGTNPGLPGLNPNVGAQGVAALGLVTPQQTGESDEQYQTRLQLSAGLMAVGFLKPGDSLIGEYGSGKPFYSQLARVVGSKIQKSGTVEQALAALRGNGVKAAELAWTGLDDFLTELKGGIKVPRSELEAHLADPAKKPVEVPGGLIAHSELKGLLAQKGDAITVKPMITRAGLEDYLATHQVDVHEVVRGSQVDDLMAARQEYAAAMQEYQATSGTEAFAAAQQRLEAANQRLRDLPPQLPTKYEGYVTPGGQPSTYRELVLTTPQRLPDRTLEPEITVSSFRNRNGGTDYHVLVNGEYWMDVGFGSERAALENAKRLWREKNDAGPPPYQSSHWPDETNPLGHVRFDERTDAQGNKVLHIVEIQSDWSQAQRSEGAKLSPAEIAQRTAPLRQEIERISEEVKRIDAQDPETQRLLADNEREQQSYVAELQKTGPRDLSSYRARREVITDALAARRRVTIDPLIDRSTELQRQIYALPQGGVPPTPFADNFNDLAVKRMLHWAVDHGFDRITWDPGAVHAQRWGTERISWEKVDDTATIKEMSETLDEALARNGGKPSNTVRWYEERIKELQANNGVGYRLLAEPQVGGNAAGVDLQGEAEARGLIQRGSPVIIRSMDDLKAHLEQAGFGAPGAREVAENRTIADKTWQRMQASDAGIFTPRKTGLETSYDTLLPQVFNKIGKVFGGKAGSATIGEAKPILKARRGSDGLWRVVDENGQNVSQRVYRSEYEANYNAHELNTVQNNPLRDVHSFDIPPAMKDAVLGEGLPLYSGVHPAVAVEGTKQLAQGAGAISKWALKNPGKTTLGSLVAFTALGAYTRAQEQAKTGQEYGEFSPNPTIQRIATFGGMAVQPRDFFEGSGIYGDQAVLPVAEWAMETIDVVPWGIAKLLGSDPNKTKGGIFNTQHTLAWVGDVFGGPTDTSTGLYDGLRKRSLEYKIDQPLASFVLSLPFDPLNWLGWGVAEKSAPKLTQALEATSAAGIASRIAKLENPKLGQVMRTSSGNRFEDGAFALLHGPRAIWTWQGQLSRASRMSQLSDEYARLAVSLAGSPQVRATAWLEDVQAKMVRGLASDDEMRLAHKLADRPKVDENAVRTLAEDLGHRLEPNDPIDPDLISEISNRVESKHQWSPDDVSWLKDQFDSLRPLENQVQTNVVNWQQGLQGGQATMDDFNKLRRLFHIDPRIVWTTGKGDNVPERLKSTLETVNDFLKQRPGLRGDGSLNTLRPSEVSYLGKVLGRKGWGLTQDTRINAWAAKYGLPDLEPVIHRAQGLSMKELSGTVALRIRNTFPKEESPLQSYIAAHPFAAKMLNSSDKVMSAVGTTVGVPLTLAMLVSVGFPVHIARSLAQRNPEVTLQGLGVAARTARNIGGVAKEAVQTGLGTSAYRVAQGLPQGPGFVAPVLVRGVKSEMGNLAFWHNAQLIDEAYLGIYGRSFLYGGHASMSGLPTDVNPLTKTFFPLGRWVGGFALGDALKGVAKGKTLDLARARAALAEPGQTALKSGALSVQDAAQIPVNPLNALAQAGGDVLHNANLGSVFGVISHSIAQMEQAFRMGFVAWQHPIMYKQVLGVLGEDTRLAQAMLDKVAARPEGLLDSSWRRVRALGELHGSSGKLSQLVNTALDGTVDRNALAQAAFQEPDLPELAKSELWGILSRSSPQDLKTAFARGGYADQMLEKVLQQTYTGRVSEQLNQVVADLTPRIAALNRKTPEGQLLYQSAVRDGWQKMQDVLNDQMQMHGRLWDWAFQAKRYAADGEKDQFFANIRTLRQKMISDGQEHALEALDLWRQQILRKGVPIPKDLKDFYQASYQKIQGAFQSSDQATTEAWAFQRAHTGPGSQAEVSAKWQAVREQNDATWRNYRAERDSDQERFYAKLQQYYAAKKGMSARDLQDAAQNLLPQPVKIVPDEARYRAQTALERIRGVADSFVSQPPVSEAQQQIIKNWAAQVDQAAGQLPKSQLDLLSHAHLATANLVMQDGNKRFINYLTRSNLDQTMSKTLFPFWQYDFHGGAFYAWMLTHVPGSAESYAREIQNTKDGPQGAGYFPGDYGVFGNEISPNRGLWDYRVRSIANFFLQNRPDGLKAEAQQAFDRVLSEGLFGAHPSPLLSTAAILAQGKGLGAVSWPPMLQQAGDLATQMTGQPYQTDQFSRRAIADQLVRMQVDPYHPTPEQYEAAVKAAAMQDLAGNAMPMFTEVLPERIAQRADFSKALTDYGYPPAAQQKWAQLHPGDSLFGMLDQEQKNKLMDQHPGWKYLFAASTFSLPPEELQKRMAISDQFEQLHLLTQSRLDDQAKYDAQVLGSKGKPATLSPAQWMDLRGSRMDRYLGAKDQLTGGSAWQAAQATLDDPERLKLLAEHPEDQAKLEYYALQADLIKKNTDDLGKINWQAVTDGTEAMLNGLSPQIQTYVRNELVRNQTPLERVWHHSLELKSQYDAIPPWIGISPDQAQRKQVVMATLNKLLSLRSSGNAQKAAAFERQNRALLHAGRPNPARIKWLLQPQNADYRFFFGRATTKNQIANATIDPSELAPWEYSPTVTGSLVAPDLNSSPDLAEAGG